MIRLAARSIIAAAIVASATANADEPIVISRELCNGIWFVPMTWTGDSGRQRELTAIFDTGGSSLLIDPDALERASGRRLAAGRSVNMTGEIAASGLKFTTFRPRVEEMDHLGAAIGRDFDVFLPFRAFRGKLLVLDYPAREIRVEAGALPAPDGKTVFSSRGRDTRPWLRVNLAGKTRRILIDSGSNGRIALRRLYGGLQWRDQPLPLFWSATMDGAAQRVGGRVSETIRIANLDFEQPIVEITDDTELMGVDVLKHFTITFDPSNQRVRFEPGTEGPIRMAPHRGTGAVFRSDPAGSWRVVRVLPGTPAVDAGLRRGDRVVEHDRRALSEPRCKPLDEPPAARTEYGVERGGRVERVVVDVVDLIE
jgi:hypothetical protein